MDAGGQLNGHLVDLVQRKGGEVDGAHGQRREAVDLGLRTGHVKRLLAQGIGQHRGIKVPRGVDEADLHREGSHLVHLQGHVHALFFEGGVLKLDLAAAAGVETQGGGQGDRLGQVALVGDFGGAGLHLAQLGAGAGEGDGLF